MSESLRQKGDGTSENHIFNDVTISRQLELVKLESLNSSKISAKKII